MEAMNLYIGWIAVLGGLLAGATAGMFFDKEDWLGGYGSWRRRMLRLAHISLVGTGLLNLAFALSVRSLRMEPCPRLASGLFILGAATMGAHTIARRPIRIKRLVIVRYQSGDCGLGLR